MFYFLHIQVLDLYSCPVLIISFMGPKGRHGALIRLRVFLFL